MPKKIKMGQMDFNGEKRWLRSDLPEYIIIFKSIYLYKGVMSEVVMTKEKIEFEIVGPSKIVVKFPNFDIYLAHYYYIDQFLTSGKGFPMLVRKSINTEGNKLTVSYDDKKHKILQGLYQKYVALLSEEFSYIEFLDNPLEWNELSDYLGCIVPMLSESQSKKKCICTSKVVVKFLADYINENLLASKVSYKVS